jgi:hypothetical protein
MQRMRASGWYLLKGKTILAGSFPSGGAIYKLI